MAAVLLPLPDRDFDLTEVLVPWDVLREAGHEVVFATASGAPGACDPLLITGPVLGQLGARPENVALYRELEACAAFQRPLRYDEIDPSHFAALILPGGHAPGMRPYLEDETLQSKVLPFFEHSKPVGAICHGPLLLARTIDPDTGRSVIHGRRVAALPRRLEWLAWVISAWKLGRYYRTYPKWVQTEVEEALGPEGHFETGPFFASYRNAWSLRDGHLVTARWPGDARAFARALLRLIEA